MNLFHMDLMNHATAWVSGVNWSRYSLHLLKSYFFLQPATCCKIVRLWEKDLIPQYLMAAAGMEIKHESPRVGTHICDDDRMGKRRLCCTVWAHAKIKPPNCCFLPILWAFLPPMGMAGESSETAREWQIGASRCAVCSGFWLIVF